MSRLQKIKPGTFLQEIKPGKCERCKRQRQKTLVVANERICTACFYVLQDPQSLSWT